MKSIFLAAIVMLAVACGQVPGNRSAASPATTPAPPQPLLFAVLQANGTANPWTYNTVAIVGLDGQITARATFAPMPVPTTGCMGPVLQSSAHVAAGRVFYADGNGVIRSLAADGTVTTVTTFPMTSSQQMLSFAVSPDGGRLLGTVFSVPTNAWPCDGSASTSSFTFDTYTATSGHPSSLVEHQTWTKPQNALALTGWDAVGPIGTYPTVYASQGGGPGSTLGRKVRVDAATVQPGADLSSPSACEVWDSIATGAFVCLGDPVMTGGGTANQKVSESVSVRGANGVEVWQGTAVGQNSPFGPLLAPDGKHVMICCNDLDLANPHELVIGQDGTQTNLATGFYATGWLDATTAIGGQQGGQSAYVNLSAPESVTSLGLTGLFVGTVNR